MRVKDLKYFHIEKCPFLGKKHEIVPKFTIFISPGSVETRAGDM